MSIIELADLELNNKTVLIRQDLNVPIIDSVITNDKRIVASLPTVLLAIKGGAKIILMSHLGRPKEGKYSDEFSLKLVAIRLSELLEQNVRLEKDYLNGVKLKVGEVVLCENVRFNVGERENDDKLAKKIANLCDIFVMDAFGSAHRTHASTYGVIKYAKVACSGILLANELVALAKVIDNPRRPMVAIVGGSKVSTKLTVLKSLAKIVDTLIPVGGIANTFIASKGFNVGRSLCEKSLINTAIELTESFDIKIPTDVVCAKEFSKKAIAKNKNLADISYDDIILDIGTNSAKNITSIISKAKTIIWNGPTGVFELEQFANGTKVLSESIAKSKAFKVAGGGDTLAAIYKYNIEDNISYMSTGGGAFLEFLEGKKLPAIQMLEAVSTH